jgi:hypothetical protein
MQVLRVGFVLVALGSGLLASSVVKASARDLVVPSLGYVALSAALEGCRRLLGRRGLPLVGGMVVVDGIFLGWATHETGGCRARFASSSTSTWWRSPCWPPTGLA